MAYAYMLAVMQNGVRITEHDNLCPLEDCAIFSDDYLSLSLTSLRTIHPLLGGHRVMRLFDTGVNSG